MLTPLLVKELQSNTNQSAMFVDLLFPLEHLPFPVNDALLNELAMHGIWDVEEAYFTRVPKSFTEPDMTEWLNILGRTMGLVYS